MGQKDGTRFEIYVENLFRDLGKLRVRRNVHYNLRKRFGKKLVKKIQVDLQFYDISGKYIVECKYLSKGKVNDDAVNKVRKNLDYLRLNKAIIATNQDFQEQARRLARKYNIILYNKKTLENLESKKLNLFGKIFRKKRGIEDMIKEINPKKYPNKNYTQTRYVW